MPKRLPRARTLKGQPKLSYYDSGGGLPGEPPILLIHASLYRSEDWENIFPRLATRYRVVSYDQRGHGRSERAPDYELRAFADDALRVLREVVKAPAVVVGHSLGAITALVAAAEAPDLVRALSGPARCARSAGRPESVHEGGREATAPLTWAAWRAHLRRDARLLRGGARRDLLQGHRPGLPRLAHVERRPERDAHRGFHTESDRAGARRDRRAAPRRGVRRQRRVHAEAPDQGLRREALSRPWTCRARLPTRAVPRDAGAVPAPRANAVTAEERRAFGPPLFPFHDRRGL